MYFNLASTSNVTNAKSHKFYQSSILSMKKLNRVNKFNCKSGANNLEEAIVVGGGIAGLATAISLERVGIRTKIFEKSKSELTTLGTLITLWPNGLKALSTIHPEIIPSLKRNGLIAETMRMVSFEGNFISEAQLLHEKLYGYPMIKIRWSKILETLKSLLPQESFFPEHEFVGLTQGDNGFITATFKKDNEMLDYQTGLLIGADGIHSLVREFVLNRKVIPRDNEKTIWRLVVPKSEIHTELFKEKSSTLGIDGGRSYVISDCGENQVYLAFTCSDSFSKGETKVRSRDPQNCKEKLLKIFSDSPAAVNIIKELNPELILERRMLDLPFLPKWSSGNVVLIGDAAHAVVPSIGQGANMAAEDALELTKQLLVNSPTEKALEMYEEIHRPRIESIVKIDRQGARQARGNAKLTSEDFEELFNYRQLTELPCLKF